MPISALQSTLYCPANFTFLNRQVHIPTLQISSFCTPNLTFLCTTNLKFSVISALPVARVHKANLTFLYCQFLVFPLTSSRSRNGNFTFFTANFTFKFLPLDTPQNARFSIPN